MESDAKAMMTRLGINDFEQSAGQLSGGQRKRLALISVLLSPADILLLDEPTNHLDNEMADWLEAYLKKRRGALIMVTHDRYFLDSVCNRIVEIDKGSVYSYQTNYSGFLELKAQREDMEMASERKRQSILRVELEWMRRGARARSTKQKARIQRYEELRDREAPAQDSKLELGSISTRLGKTTVELEHICKSYEDRKLIDDFNYIFLKGDRVGIVGPNGCGKSTLLKIIAGMIPYDSGQVIIGQTVKMGYYAQEIASEKPGEHGGNNEIDLSYMDPDQRVIDYVKDTAEFIQTEDGVLSASAMLERFLFSPEKHEIDLSYMDPDQRVIDYVKDTAEFIQTEDGVLSASAMLERFLFSPEKQYSPIGYMDPDQRVIDYVKDTAEFIQTEDGVLSASAMLERFLFSPEKQYSPIGKLSGGEKKRLNLLRVLAASPNFILLDEPTNNLDIATLTILEDYLDRYEGIAVVVSHDRYFLDRTMKRIFAFEENGRLRQYEGGYTDYAMRKEAEGWSEQGEMTRSAAKLTAPAKEKGQRTRGPQKLKFTYKEQKDYETIEADMAELEARIAALDQEIEASAHDFVKLNQLMAEKEELEAALEEKMERWMYLEDLAAKIAKQ